jgi:transposase InsO family protein
MAYSNNPNLAKARGQAVLLVMRDGLPKGVVARKYGINRTTLWRWLKRWQTLNSHVSQDCSNRPQRQTKFCAAYYTWLIPTRSSRPLSYPRALPQAIVDLVLELRQTLRRCAEVIHYTLVDRGIQISLSSVKRILARHHCYDRKKYQKKLYRKNPKRPLVSQPGQLVQVDAVHLVNLANNTRKYVVTVIDLYSRMAYARVFNRLNQIQTVQTVLAAQAYFGFNLQMVQADNGPEFGGNFRARLGYRGIAVRHSRPYRPNDNAHIERFNRTLREECFKSKSKYSVWHTRSLRQIQGRLDEFIDYYNYHRVHLGLQYRVPAMVRGCC